VSAEYSQITLFEISESDRQFKEHRHIISDRSVLAASHRWLAYCGEPSAAKTAPVTDFHCTVIETRTATVAKSLKDGIARVGEFLYVGGSTSTTHDQLGVVTVTDVSSGRDICSFVAHQHNLQYMKFDATGTLLATASVAGTNINLWQILPAAAGSKASASVVLLARLSRGITTGVVTSIDFAPLNTWIVVSTSIGTCHIYNIPTAVSSRVGASVSEAATYEAPTLLAVCRCRSAPTSSPVDPVVCFSPWLVQRPRRTQLCVATAAASVAVFDLTEHGVAVILTQHLTEFSGAPEDDDPSEGAKDEPSVRTASEVEAKPVNTVAADTMWRSQIELRTHPPCPKIRGLRVVREEDGGAAIMSGAAGPEVVSVDADWNEA
jgi:hypothetical protein